MIFTAFISFGQHTDGTWCPIVSDRCTDDWKLTYGILLMLAEGWWNGWLEDWLGGFLSVFAIWLTCLLFCWLVGWMDDGSSAIWNYLFLPRHK